MPMNEFGEIIRNSSPPPPIPPRNNGGRNNRNRGNGLSLSSKIFIGLALLVLGFLIVQAINMSHPMQPPAQNTPAQSNVDTTPTQDDSDYLPPDEELLDDSDEDNEWEYIFYDSDSSYIDEDMLDQLTQEEVQLARNEIYARHGRKFTNEKIRAYFEDKSWYSPEIEADVFDEQQDSIFNKYEKKNITTIVEYEKKQGWK